VQQYASNWGLVQYFYTSQLLTGWSDPRGTWQGWVDTSGEGASIVNSWTQTDNLGRLTHYLDITGHLTTTEYDQRGKVVTKKTSHYNSAAPGGRHKSFGLDTCTTTTIV
jgi:YD repeat-containing protein